MMVQVPECFSLGLASRHLLRVPGPAADYIKTSILEKPTEKPSDTVTCAIYRVFQPDMSISISAE
jgi:hypothetical protein